jgi:hypothetical protein
MCPFCLLTALAVASGAISAGGVVGAIFIAKVRTEHPITPVGNELELRRHEGPNRPQIGETMRSATDQELVNIDEANSQSPLRSPKTFTQGEL